MKNNITNLLLICLVFLASCNPKITTSILQQQPALDPKTEVAIFDQKEEVPSVHKLLGSVYIGDTGFSTNCSYPVVIDAAKTEARKIGGNSLLITRHDKPNLLSSCHRINANILSIQPNHLSQNQTSVFTEQTLKQSNTKDELGLQQFNSKWRFAIQGGYSIRIAKIVDGVSADYKSYLKELNKGFHLGGDISYFPNGNDIGFGVKYNYYSANNSGDFFLENDAGDIQNIRIKDDIKINFIGPSFLMRYPSRKNLNAFYMGMALGYMSYADDASYFEDFTITGKTLGVSFDFGYDFATSDNMAIGIQLSLVGGTLSKITYDNGIQSEVIELDDDSKESLTRIDLSIGLRFLK